MQLQSMNVTRWAAVLLFLFCADRSLGAHHELNVPPKGFKALFNGKDLTGWWGLGTENPRKFMAMSPGHFRFVSVLRWHIRRMATIVGHWRFSLPKTGS